jgi:hypothetical protein
MERRTREIWSNLVRQLERSGLTPEQFAEKRGIPPKTLRWWMWRLRTGSEGPSLLPVRVIASTAPTARDPEMDGAAIEVMLPDGVRLRFERGVGSEVVVEVVARLRRC